MDLRREGDARRQGVAARVTGALCAAVAWALCGAVPAVSAPVDAALARWSATAAPSDTRAVWAMLRYHSDDARPALTPRALARRMRRAPASLGDLADRPLAAADLEALAAAGLRVRQQSRWLRAVSGDATPAALARLAALPQVTQVLPVRGWRETRHVEPQALDVERAPLAPAQPTVLLSHSQNASLEIDQLQTQGYHGEGIVIGMLDTGATAHHPAFAQTQVLATYDFLHHDTVIDNESGQDLASQRYHGTETWSVIGGYQPGVFEGGAYAAQFALAKTEDVAHETHIEEDTWIAGLEWADSLGADVVSSSLGYSTFEDGSGYTKAQLDGNTALTTIAADMAVARGLVVVSAMGNSGATSWQKMLTPADADSVLSIGAIDSLGVLASFSSRGPTADGRIKPDLVARGVNVVVANPIDTLSYGYIGGTSLATPLVASLCALLLQAHPDWSPMTLRDALRSTADRASAPDTLYGWGKPSGLQALAYAGSSVTPPGGGDPHAPRLLTLGAPAHSAAIWWLTAGDGEAAEASLRIFASDGRCVRTLAARLPAGNRRAARFATVRQTLVRWDLRDEHGRRVAPGRYFARTTVDGAAVTGSVLVD